MTTQTPTALRGLDDSNFYTGAAGQMTGSDTFAASAMFRIRGTQRAALEQDIWGTIDSGGGDGWLIALTNINTLRMQVEDSLGPQAAVFDLSTLRPLVFNKILVATMVVGGGELNAFVNGQLVAGPVALTGGVTPATNAARVGATGGGADNGCIDLDIFGVAYHNAALPLDIVEKHALACMSQNKMASITGNLDEPSKSAGSDWLNRFDASTLAVGAVPGVIERPIPGSPEGVEVDALPIPGALWNDALAPSGFAPSANSPALGTLQSLTRTGFALGNQGRGLISLPNARWF